MDVIVRTCNSLVRAALHSAVDRFSENSIARMSGKEMVAPCYHMVTDDSPVHTRHLYKERSVAEFERDLDYLLRHYKPISLQEITEWAQSGAPTPPNNSFFLSFDDGFREMGEIVAPICLKKGVPATFFLTSGFLDNQTLGFRHKASLLIEFCHRRRIDSDAAELRPLLQSLPFVKNRSTRSLFLSLGYAERHVMDECAQLLGVDFEEFAQKGRPYLSGDQVRSLIRNGFSIGGHSVDHPLYADLSPAERIRQTRECMLELTERFEVPVKAFAFPFVSDGVDERFFEQVRNSVDMFFCIGRMPPSRYKAIQRFGVESSQKESIPELLRRQLEGRLRRRLFSRKGLAA